MRALGVALSVATAVAAVGAAAEPSRPDLCAPGVRHRGAAIDLDVKGADLQDVFRLIADAAHVNVVLPDDVSGKVTLRLLHVPWETVACAVARSHHLGIEIDGNILVVMRAAPPDTP
jgi:type IV pilus assembly protein PilQ